MPSGFSKLRNLTMKVCVVFLLAFACQAQLISATGLADRMRSVSAAAGWLLGQRGEDSTWGEQTPRAVVALALAEDAYPLTPDEWRMMGKHVNIQLSLELAKPNGLTQLGLTRTALYMNALLATCQDPTRFHGLDLARDLRERLNARLNSSAALPAAYLALCLAGRAQPYHDVRVLQRAYAMHEARLDLRAIAVQAMACVQLKEPAVAPGVNSYVDSFHKWFPTVTDIVDVYTRALGYQALNAAGRGVSDVGPLLRHQTQNGSFGSLLATYYAIPALQNSSFLALKDRPCQFDRVSEDKMLVGSAVPKVFFSLWMGEGQERDTHSLTLHLESANATFFDLMNVASNRNPVFRFSWENSAVGKKVYSVAGRPNDVEREIYWTLYRTKGSPNGLDPKLLNLKDLVNTGVDRVRPKAGDHFVFWFRRKPQQH